MSFHVYTQLGHWDHSFLVIVQTDRQTGRRKSQTHATKRCIPATVVGVSNE